MFVRHIFLKVKFSDRIDENGTNIHFHSLMSIVVIPLNDVFCLCTWLYGKLDVLLFAI